MAGGQDPCEQGVCLGDGPDLGFYFIQGVMRVQFLERGSLNEILKLPSSPSWVGAAGWGLQPGLMGQWGVEELWPSS